MKRFQVVRLIFGERLPVCALAMWAGLAQVDASLAGEAGAPGSGRVEVLKPDDMFRFTMGWRTPEVVDAAGKIKPAPEGKEQKPMKEYESAPPPAGWSGVAFNDTGWARGKAPVVMSGHDDSVFGVNIGQQLCVRGKFLVDDPAALKGLRLSLEYVGGAAVYVNGKEIKRAHLPDGELKSATLAEKYADDVFLNDQGLRVSDLKKDGERLARRIRRVEGLEIDPKLLRKGLNVVAVQLYRAPVSEAVAAAKPAAKRAILPHLGLLGLSLTAGGGSAVEPAGAAPKGVRIWNPGPLETVTAADPGDPQAGPWPMTIQALRNGVYSAQLALSSALPIRGLRVSVSDLARADGGKIPTASLRVRYAEPSSPEKSWVGRNRFDALLDAAPAEVAAVKTRTGGLAAQPVWLTVRVDADTQAGEYRGDLSVQAEGLDPVKVPVVVKVHDWKLPAPVDFTAFYNFLPSHESVAKHYGLPLWSDKHFEMIGKEAELLNEFGCRYTLVPLVINYIGMGTTESMVRWVRQADGSYKHDFTVLDKYLDVIEKKTGKPRILRFDLARHDTRVYPVSLLDPATGALTALEQPAVGTPESEAFWKAVLTELRARIEKRGWLDVTVFGCTSYAAAMDPTMLGVIRKWWPDCRGMNTSHTHFEKWKTAAGEFVPVPFSDAVWRAGRLYDPDAPNAKGYPMAWKLSPPGWHKFTFPREGAGALSRLRDSASLSYFRMSPEATAQTGDSGLGNMGADFWPVKRPDGKAHITLCSNTQLSVGACLLALLSPGADGPIANERYERFREGAQVVEAIFFLQKAMDAGKLDAGMAQRIRTLLDERARPYVRFFFSSTWPMETMIQFFEGSGTEERDERLYALCAEVEALGKTGGK